MDTPQITTAQAVKHFGSRYRVAKLLGITLQAVCKWGKYPPLGRRYQLRELMNEPPTWRKAGFDSVE